MVHGNQEKFEGSGVKPHLVARWAEPLGTNAECGKGRPLRERLAHGNREKFEGSGVKPHLVARGAAAPGHERRVGKRGASPWARTPSGKNGAAHVNRTRDPFITNEVLYQLS
jgi:hypothetical protein